LASSGEVLASLTGVSASSLDPAMFVWNWTFFHYSKATS
jgi:hypothetical protein